MKKGWRNLEKIEITLENMPHVLLQQCTACGDYKGKTQNRNTHFVDVEVCVRDVRVDGCRQ